MIKTNGKGSLPNREWLVPEELARWRDVSTRTVYKAIRKGTLKHIAVGAGESIPRYLIRHEWALEWAAAAEAETRGGKQIPREKSPGRQELATIGA